MYEAYFSVTKRLDQVLDPHILWLSNADMERFFQVSDSKRKRDAEVLRELAPKGFNPNWKNRRGYNRAALSVWWEFYQLSSMFDRDEAIAMIGTVMEALNERQRQRTYQAS